MAKRSAPAALPLRSLAARDDWPDAVDAAAPRTMIEQAYAQLRDDIVEGRLATGEKLRVEHLRLRYGVGAGTLREALTRLVSDALVETEGQRGFRVSPITAEDLDDLTNLRVQIEIEALRQSIRRGHDGWRAELRHVYEHMSAIEQPILPHAVQRWEVLNTQFHEVLLANCGSAWTLRLLRVLNRHSERYRRYAIGLNQGTRDVHAEHHAIFDAALNGNELRAALALEAHIRATPDLLQRSIHNGVSVFTRLLADSTAHPAIALQVGR